MRSTKLLALVVASATAAAGAGGTSAVERETPEGLGVDRVRFGPLAGPPPNGFAAGDLKVGAEFTDGQLVIFNESEKKIRIVRVKPVIAGDELEYLGARLAPPTRQDAFYQFLTTFPPSAAELPVEITEAEGAVLLPGEAAATRGYEVLMGYRVVAAGRATVKRVEIEFEVDGRRRMATYIKTLAVCSDGRAECEQETGER